ncbi:MAG: phosphoribosylanthranilate isomerase [Pseudomonadota bacterium]
MVRVKICGITRIRDALWAVRCGVDALGFIFAESPRRVSPEKAKAIIDTLPPFVRSVGVFVDEQPRTLLDIATFCGLDLVQLHGEETPDYCRNLPFSAIKAFRIRNPSSLSAINSYRGVVKGAVLDTYHSVKMGGTGETFDWKLAVKARKYGIPIILSGGLTPENIQQAVRMVRPYAVDVNSGVENRPGQKDAVLVEQIMNRIGQLKP